MDEARGVRAINQDGDNDDKRSDKMPGHDNHSCPSAREAILLLRAHTQLDDTRFEQVMDSIERMETATAKAHEAIHNSIQSNNSLVLNGFKLIVRGLIAVVVAMFSSIIGLLVYIWAHKDGIIT